MSRKANNLYNQCVYFAKHSENLSEDLKNLDKVMKSFPDEHDNYRSFGYARCAQQVLRLFQQNLRSYFAAIDDYKKNPTKYTGRPFISQTTNKVAAIDVGLSNLATVTFSSENEPILYRSDLMKINRDFNRLTSNYVSILKKTQNKDTSKRRKRYSEKYSGLIEDRLHKLSREIINDLSHRGVSTVIVGKNTGQKINNKFKNFVQVPLFRLIEMIKYKAELAGITFVQVNESYTSGTSFLDNELPTKEYYDKSRRKFRGLFLSNDSKRINADVNASFQIMKKVYREFTYTNSVKYANPIVKTIC